MKCLCGQEMEFVDIKEDDEHNLVAEYECKCGDILHIYLAEAEKKIS